MHSVWRAKLSNSSHETSKSIECLRNNRKS
jgi:hypothetical protein